MRRSRGAEEEDGADEKGEPGGGGEGEGEGECGFADSAENHGDEEPGGEDEGHELEEGEEECKESGSAGDLLEGFFEAARDGGARRCGGGGRRGNGLFKQRHGSFSN